MKKETLSFAAFLSLNGFLSVNCLFYGMTKDSTRPQVTVEVSQEKKLNQLKSARVLVYPNKEKFIRFSFQNSRSVCMSLSSKKFLRSVSELEECEDSEEGSETSLYPFPAPHRYLSDTKKQEVYVKKEQLMQYIFRQQEMIK